MSPLWRDEVGVHLSPERVCMVRLRRGLRPRVVAEYEQVVKAHSASVAAAETDSRCSNWSASLATVEQLLAEPQWRGAALRIVIADCWVRYSIVPWAADLRSAPERLAHARQLLASAFGEAVSGWELRLSEAAPGFARVACAMPTELLADVGALAARHQVPLASLQPQLIFAYDNWRCSLPAAGAWFVTIGDGTLTAVRMGNRAWDRVHSIRIGPDWARELKRLQKFGRLASANTAEGAVYVDAPQAWREVAGPDGNELHWLEAQREPPTTLQRLGRVRRLAA